MDKNETPKNKSKPLSETSGVLFCDIIKQCMKNKENKWNDSNKSSSESQSSRCSNISEENASTMSSIHSENNDIYHRDSPSVPKSDIKKILEKRTEDKSIEYATKRKQNGSETTPHGQEFIVPIKNRIIRCYVPMINKNPCRNMTTNLPEYLLLLFTCVPFDCKNTRSSFNVIKGLKRMYSANGDVNINLKHKHNGRREHIKSDGNMHIINLNSKYKTKKMVTPEVDSIEIAEIMHWDAKFLEIEQSIDMGRVISSLPKCIKYDCNKQKKYKRQFVFVEDFNDDLSYRKMKNDKLELFTYLEKTAKIRENRKKSMMNKRIYVPCISVDDLLRSGLLPSVLKGMINISKIILGTDNLKASHFLFPMASKKEIARKKKAKVLLEANLFSRDPSRKMIQKGFTYEVTRHNELIYNGIRRSWQSLIMKIAYYETSPNTKNAKNTTTTENKKENKTEKNKESTKIINMEFYHSDFLTSWSSEKSEENEEACVAYNADKLFPVCRDFNVRRVDNIETKTCTIMEGYTTDPSPYINLDALEIYFKEKNSFKKGNSVIKIPPETHRYIPIWLFPFVLRECKGDLLYKAIAVGQSIIEYTEMFNKFIDDSVVNEHSDGYGITIEIADMCKSMLKAVAAVIEMHEFNVIKARMYDLKNINLDYLDKMNELEKNNQKMNAKIDQLNKKIDSITTENISLKKENAVLKNDMNMLDKKLSFIMNKLNLNTNFLHDNKRKHSMDAIRINKKKRKKKCSKIKKNN